MICIVKILTQHNCHFAQFQKKCVNNPIFCGYFVNNPVTTIESDPPKGLGVDLSEEAEAELIKLIDNYLGSANMMVAENESEYPNLYHEVRHQCRDVPDEEPIGSI